MIKRPKVKKESSLPEAEARLEAALDRLSTVVQSKAANHGEIETLRQENSEMEVKWSFPIKSRLVAERRSCACSFFVGQWPRVIYSMLI